MTDNNPLVLDAGSYFCFEDIMNPRLGGILRIMRTPLWFWAVP